MNIQLLSAVVEELSQNITSSRIERVYEGPTGLCLALRKGRSHYYLLLSADRSLPRLHLISKKPAAVPTPHSFSLYLRSHAAGGTIKQVSLLGGDRVVEIVFSRQGTEYRLIIELFGSSANIIIADGSLSILAVRYPTTFSDSVKRPLAQGLRYLPPERRNAGPHVPAASAPEETAGALSANREAEQQFEQLIREQSFERLRARLRSLVKKLLVKTERRLEAVSGDLKAAELAEEYKKAGSLILANLRIVERGRDQVELKDYDGQTIVLRLDPKKSATGNAEMYFRKYKKAKAGREIIAQRLDKARGDAERLRSYLADLEQADGIDALEGIQSALAADGYLPDAKRGKKEGRPAAPVPFRTIEYLGWEILVGKSAAGNDYITTKIARPHDLWLHAEGMPGSHVLVRNPGGKDIPPEVLLRAASLAAFYSKGKGSGKVPVAYTAAGQVRKPKGAKPGLVMLMTRKTIMAVPAG